MISSYKRLFSSFILGLCFFMLSATNLSAAEYTITQLTNNNYNDYFADIHQGQVTWYGYDGNDNEIFLYDGAKTIQLTNDNYNYYHDLNPQIHNGQVVWQGYRDRDWEIFLYNGNQTIQLSDNYYEDREPKIHNGQVVWQTYYRYDWEIFFYDGSRVIQLTDNNDLDLEQQIDNGQVVWRKAFKGIFLYDGNRTIQLTDNSSANAPKIDHGQVVWQIWDGNDSEVFFYNGSRTIQLTDNKYSDFLPQIHNGQITWTGYDGHDYEIFLYNGNRTIQLTNNDYDDADPKIHNGQVVWEIWDGNDYEIFLYDGNQIIQLTNNNYKDYAPRIHNGQITWWGYDGNDYEIYLATPKETPLEILDGSDFSGGREVSTNPQDLASGGTPVTGAVTDGVTRLLLRLTADKPQTVTFSLQGTGNPKEDGILKSIDSQQQGNLITITTTELNSKHYAFAIYQSPEDFTRQNYPEDKTASERNITLKIDYGSFAPLQQEIKLVRPPLILMHGLWSSRDMWLDSEFAQRIKLAIPDIYLVPANYEATNASHFDVNKEVVSFWINRAKDRFRSHKIAMVQADVLGHSMGGLLARIYAAGEEYYGKGWYLNDKNFKEGTINKLITLDSPHYGSFFADAGIACLRGQHSLKAHILFKVMEAKKRSLTKGAVEDMMTTSKPIEGMNKTKIILPSHAIIGNYNVTIKPIVPYTEPTESKDLMVVGLPSDYFDIHNMLIQEGYGDGVISNLRLGSDLVVSIYSQKGGLETPAFDIFTHHHTGATTQDVVNKTAELLNIDTDSNLFNSGFPKK